MANIIVLDNCFVSASDDWTEVPLFREKFNSVLLVNNIKSSQAMVRYKFIVTAFTDTCHYDLFKVYIWYIWWYIFISNCVIWNYEKLAYCEIFQRSLKKIRPLKMSWTLCAIPPSPKLLLSNCFNHTALVYLN